MILGYGMGILVVLAILLQAALIHILNKKIPSMYVQREEGERIIRQRSFKDINRVKAEFDSYFHEVLSMLGWTKIIYAILTVVIFLLFQGLLYSISLPPPKPGPFMVPKYVVSAFLTLIVTSFGWIKILLEQSSSRLLKQEITSKYVLLGVFKQDD